MADALAECCVEVVSQAVKISIIACETEVAVGPDGEGGSLVGRVRAGEFGRGVADERGSTVVATYAPGAAIR